MLRRLGTISLLHLNMSSVQQPQPRSRSMFAFFWGPHDFSNDADIGRVTVFSLLSLGFGATLVLCHIGLSKAGASWALGAGAFFAVGMSAGFIFGIPRGSHKYVNSNLEQISDWLTKILVGVGL